MDISIRNIAENTNMEMSMMTLSYKNIDVLMS